MAPVILAMDVHCGSCAKKIRKAIMKVPGAESVTASYETGLVVVEGTADAAAVMARLRARTNKAVRVVSDGVEEDGEAAAAGASASGSVNANPPPPAGPADDPPAPAPPIVLEMDLHCRSCAEKVERRVMEIPGVDAVTTDVPGRRVEVTGTADASTVATSVEVRMRRPVRVVSDPRSAGDAPARYDHEQRKAAAARAAAEQMWELYGATTAHAEPRPQEVAATDNASNHSSSPSSAACPAGGGECYGQHWPAYQPPEVGAFYTHQGGDCFGQQYRPAYPPPEPEPEGYYYPYGGQPADENPGSCSIQ
ncbi:heavy metal-associated isoprenylated plant protein 6-like [Panicum virgatum]|uniref:heavy metal-associated isoprenylated plant protein 6-like n=1 Tax=Panicum virgatum TaxID=38727 RepID=UPI0019D54D24|nr:heavy metal-associated isoprenylated plant protein 6-like [Panicum virgatum]